MTAKEKTTGKKDILILLKRNNPTEYEIHRWEIAQAKNLILKVNDLEFAENIVNSYNKYNS